MSDIKIIITGDESGLNKATNQATADLGRIAIAAQKTDSSLAKMGGGMSGIGTIAQKTASSIGSLAGSLISGGLITAVAAAGLALFELGKKLFDVSAAQKRFNEVLEGAKSAYVKAVLEVDKMRDAFQKAKDGIITKESVLKLYNSTIGKTIGQTNNLDIAEKNFISNAENYIKYTLLKSAANIALGKAAESAFKVEQEKMQGLRNNTLMEVLSGKGITLGDASRRIAQEERIKESLKEQNDFKKIYNSLIEQANALGFKAVQQQESEVKVIKKKTEAQKEYVKEVRSSLLPQNTGESGPLSRASGSTLTPTVVLKPKISIEVTPEEQQKVLNKMEEMFSREKLADFQKNATEAIASTITNIASDSISLAADAIGEAIAGNTEAMPNLFEGLVKSIGNQVKELGKYLVELGVKMIIAKKAAENLSINPYTAIAAGAALQILGSALTASFKKRANTGFASGSTGIMDGGIYDVGERGPERIFLPAGAKVQPNNELNAFGGGNQVFIPAVTLSGPDLVIAFNRASQMMNRNN